ncbi:translation initiation factor IF-2-like [Corvus hawaiiensis]|uniref:translation initiation factor IF-2-like n=1 Tax=Corvus hawaiiensis TaxID=134902 RepID=UPI0020184982|nr:translation initiation factor IF-2-like [Corvus hawaiiensis]
MVVRMTYVLQRRVSLKTGTGFTGLESKTRRSGLLAALAQGGRLRKCVSTKQCGNTPRKANERCISLGGVNYGTEALPCAAPPCSAVALGEGRGAGPGPLPPGSAAPAPPAGRPRRASRLRSLTALGFPAAGGREEPPFPLGVTLGWERRVQKRRGGKARRQPRPPALAAPAARHAAARAAAAPLPAGWGTPGPPPRSRRPAESARLVPAAPRAQPLRAEAV